MPEHCHCELHPPRHSDMSVGCINALPWSGAGVCTRDRWVNTKPSTQPPCGCRKTQSRTFLCQYHDGWEDAKNEYLMPLRERALGLIECVKNTTGAEALWDFINDIATTDL